MNKVQIKNKVKQIKIMDLNQLNSLISSISVSLASPESKKQLFEAIDKRRKELQNSFSLEVEQGEYKAEEMS